MKKIIVGIMLMFISVLSACSSTVTSLEKVEDVPTAVQDSIKPKAQ